MADGILDPETLPANALAYGVPSGLIPLLLPRPAPEVFALDVWHVIRRLVSLHQDQSGMTRAEQSLCAVAFCQPDLLGQVPITEALQQLSDVERQAASLWPMFI